MKVAILGYSGSGKSTLAKHLSTHYNIPLLYLDTIQFEADWKERDKSEAISMVDEFMSKNDWIIDGNYVSFLQQERLKQADYIIYMAFSRFDCLLRVYRRLKKYKNASRESISKGCNERMDSTFVWWILYKGRTRKKRKYYKDLLNIYHAKSIILKNQKQLDRFMLELFDGRTKNSLYR